MAKSGIKPRSDWSQSLWVYVLYLTHTHRFVFLLFFSGCRYVGCISIFWAQVWLHSRSLVWDRAQTKESSGLCDKFAAKLYETHVHKLTPYSSECYYIIQLPFNVISLYSLLPLHKSESQTQSSHMSVQSVSHHLEGRGERKKLFAFQVSVSGFSQWVLTLSKVIFLF